MRSFVLQRVLAAVGLNFDLSHGGTPTRTGTRLCPCYYISPLSLPPFRDGIILASVRGRGPPTTRCSQSSYDAAIACSRLLVDVIALLCIHDLI